jgi:hypothetical protein
LSDRLSMANQNQNTHFFIKPEGSEQRKSTLNENNSNENNEISLFDRKGSSNIEEKKKVEDIVNEKTVVINKKKPKLKKFGDNKETESKSQLHAETNNKSSLFGFNDTAQATKQEDKQESRKTENKKSLFDFDDSNDNNTSQNVKKVEPKAGDSKAKINFLFEDE